VIDKTPRSFSKEEELILEGLAKIVMDEIELRLSSISETEKLQDANQGLVAINAELKGTNEELHFSRSKLKESEENLQTLADNISQLAWMADENGSLFWYNRRWYEYTGTTKEEMMGNGWQKVHHPDHVARVISKFHHDIAVLGKTWEDTFPLRGADGQYCWFLSRAVPFKDEQGKIIRWLGTNTDITEQRNLSEQKDDFLSIASHELKTPITSLRGSLQVLDRLKDNPSSTILPKFVNQANRSMERISTLVDDLLNVSKMSDGQLHLSKKTFVLSDMIDNSCHHIHLDGTCKIVFEGDRELMVYADEHRIEQVIVNFVNNAVKYAPDSPEIVIKVEQIDDTARVSVRDSGNGIAPDQTPHLFNRYYRADYPGSQYSSGLGLGLYISAEIVRRHDGRIGVESKVGKGSEFWFTLPMPSMLDLLSEK
jgi:PAS domain S-box-containing protein